jgi:mRNA interferase RelE/StbE
MTVTITKTFAKNYKKTPLYIQQDIDIFYHKVVEANDIRSLTHIKKLVGFKDYYRFKIGDYRLGFQLVDNTILFVTILHRKDIYKFFP